MRTIQTASKSTAHRSETPKSALRKIVKQDPRKVKPDQLSKSSKSSKSIHSEKKLSTSVEKNKSKSVESTKKDFKVAKKSKPIEAEKEKTEKLSARSSLLPVVKPKRPLTAFLVFINKEYAKITKNGEQVRIGKKTRELSEKWKLMTDDQKMKYMQIAKADRERYDHEMAQLKTQGFFITDEGVKSTEIPRKLKQFDKNKVVLPKQTRSAMCFFVRLNEHKYRKQNEKSNLAETTQAWTQLSDEEKRPYIDMSLKDKIRRHHECEQLTTLGYFVNERGVKSTDMKVKVTREVIKQRREQAEKIKLEEKENRIKMRLKQMKIKTEETAKQLKQREKKQMRKLNEKKRLEREQTREKKLRDLEKEKKLRFQEKEKALKLALKEKKLKAIEKDQALKTKQKAIYEQQSQRDEQIGWQRFYRKNFAHEFENDFTPNKTQRKINVDENLRNRWLSLAMITKKIHIKKAKEVLAARVQKRKEIRAKNETKKTSKSSLLVKRNKPSTLAA